MLAPATWSKRYISLIDCTTLSIPVWTDIPGDQGRGWQRHRLCGPSSLLFPAYGSRFGKDIDNHPVRSLGLIQSRLSFGSGSNIRRASDRDGRSDIVHLLLLSPIVGNAQATIATK